MNQISPAALAPLIPVAPNEQVFQYSICLDGSFEVVGASGAVKVDITKLPAQVYKTIRKPGNGEAWTIGFNVFSEGVDVKYQSFFWLNGPPSNGAITSSSTGTYQQASPPVTLTLSDSEHPVAFTNIPCYNWLTCTVTAVLVRFQQELSDLEVSPSKPNPQLQIAKSNKYSNQSNTTITITDSVQYDYTQTCSSTITDTHSFEAGLELGFETSVDWFLGESSFSINLSLKYGYTHETQSSESTTSNYTVSDSIQVSLEPGQSKHVSLVLSADHHATASIYSTITLTGTLAGQSLTGDFLRQVAVAMDPSTVILETGPDFVRYRIHGQINANVAVSGDVIVSDSELSLDSRGQLQGTGMVWRTAKAGVLPVATKV